MNYEDYIDDIKYICERNNLLQEAERLYTKEINVDKNNATNYVRRAYFYMRNGKKEKAIRDCKTAQKLSPKDETILTIIELLLKQLEQMK